MSLSGEAAVHTLEGDLLVVDLAARGNSTCTFFWDGDRITVGRVMVRPLARQTTTELTLDDGTCLYLQPESYVLLKSGTYQRAKDLSPGDSLLPLYLKESKDGPTYRDPGDWFKDAPISTDKRRWRRVARMVAEWKIGRRLQRGDNVEHIDGVKSNCAPENLKISRRKSKTTSKVKFAEPLFEAQRLLRRYTNHKVERVRSDVSRDLFSIRGLDSSNLAVSGIFVCTDEN